MKPLNEKMAAKKIAKGPTTPAVPHSAEVRRVLGRLPNPQDALFLDFADVGAGYHGAACHMNAKHLAMSPGGRRVHGWAIWQYPSFAQAEFHSVWEDLDGNLVDVTPHRNGQTKVMFVRDPSLVIERDPETGRAILFSAITSSGAPYYKMAETPTTSPVYTFQVKTGSELDEELIRLGLLDLV
ncbi:hypothetical protein [Brevundimonas variabilis]|uniref:Uncharacterized protein n=1 Tax=Brevundimonas variabilis TaxID=74312 RepID=A0A7W9CJ29_9CAUL|nr:hypothetical protein [Brevundimonas variabilis]MBB5746610.1 hypothetical protein [Brevundimonas variabilis]